MNTAEEIKAFNQEFSAAVLRGDTKAVVDMYDDEAVFLMAGVPTAKGHPSLTELFTQLAAAGPIAIALESEHVWEAGGLVVDVGTLTMGEGTGRYAVVYRRRPDGSLALLVDAPIPDPPG